MAGNVNEFSLAQPGGKFRLRLPDLAPAPVTPQLPGGLIVLEQLIGAGVPRECSHRRQRWLSHLLAFTALSVTIVSAAALVLAWKENFGARAAEEESQIATDEIDEQSFQAQIQPRKGAAFDIGQIPPSAPPERGEPIAQGRAAIERTVYHAPRVAPRQPAWLTGGILDAATPTDHADKVP